MYVAESIAQIEALLRQRLQADEQLRRHVTVVSGPSLALSQAPEAQRLREAGASWEWVALQFRRLRFWDIHVGVLPIPHAPARSYVGLHWSTAIEPLVGGWAQTLVPAGRVRYSDVAREHQLNISLDGSTGELDAEDAVTAACAVAAEVCRSNSMLGTLLVGVGPSEQSWQRKDQ